MTTDPDMIRWARMLNENLNEDGMSIDDILAKGKEVQARHDAEQAAIDAEKNAQRIKSIWVKSLNFDDLHPNNSFAELVITYADGKTKDDKFPIATSGSGTGFENDDRQYKVTLQTLRRYGPKGVIVNPEDVTISLIHQAFNDSRIFWQYGKDKKLDSVWAFSRANQRLEKSTGISRMSKPAKAVAPSSYRDGQVTYKSGNTTIYKPR